MSVYCLHKKEIAPGEIIRITQNDRDKGLVNGDRAKVMSMDTNKVIHLHREDEKNFKLDGSNPLHLDYGYYSTVHSAQGRTCERVLIEADTKSLTSAQDNYYVAISRARHEARIYTDNKEKLPDAMSRTHEKKTALEIDRKEPERDKQMAWKQAERTPQELNKPRALETGHELDR